MTDEFDPLTGELLPKSTKQSAGATNPKPFLPNLSDEELQRLLDDPDALRKEIKSTLISLMKTAPRNISLLGVCRELTDRLDGKAPQSVSMTVRTNPEASLTTDQLNALLALLPDPVIIPPMPKKLDTTTL